MRLDQVQETEKALKAVSELLQSPVLSYGNVIHLTALKARLEKELSELRNHGDHSAAAD